MSDDDMHIPRLRQLAGRTAAVGGRWTVSHYIERCLCGVVISQCRCPSKDKATRLGECDACRLKRLAIASCPAAHAAQQRQRQQRSIVTPDREGR